jgi:hypothetical protein
VEEVVVEVMQVDKATEIVSDHGNCESKYGEFEFGGE